MCARDSLFILLAQLAFSERKNSCSFFSFFEKMSSMFPRTIYKSVMIIITYEEKNV